MDGTYGCPCSARRDQQRPQNGPGGQHKEPREETEHDEANSAVHDSRCAPIQAESSGLGRPKGEASTVTFTEAEEHILVASPRL